MLLRCVRCFAVVCVVYVDVLVVWCVYDVWWCGVDCWCGFSVVLLCLCLR